MFYNRFRRRAKVINRGVDMLREELVSINIDISDIKNLSFCEDGCILECDIKTEVRFDVEERGCYCCDGSIIYDKYKVLLRELLINKNEEVKVEWAKKIEEKEKYKKELTSQIEFLEKVVGKIG